MPRFEGPTVIDARAHPREYTLAEIRAAFHTHNWRLRRVWTHTSATPNRSAILAVACRAADPLGCGETIFAVAECLPS